MFTYIQIVNFILTSFLKYRKDISDLSGYFGHAWPNPSSMIVSTCRKLWCLSAPKINFSWDMTKILQTFFSGYFRHDWLCLPKLKVWTSWIYLHAKNQLHLSHLSWDIAMILQTRYFGYFGCACLCSPKMIISTWRKLCWCLSSSKKTIYPSPLSWNIAKILQTYYFRHYRDACPRPSTTNIKSTWSLASLKNPRILQSDWWRAFWPITGEPEFCQKFAGRYK